jgi:hypothetical protein
MSDSFDFGDLLIGPEHDGSGPPDSEGDPGPETAGDVLIDTAAADGRPAGADSAGDRHSAGVAESSEDQGPGEEEPQGPAIKPPPELDGPNADLAMDAMRMQHESIMSALRNIR